VGRPCSVTTAPRPAALPPSSRRSCHSSILPLRQPSSTSLDKAWNPDPGSLPARTAHCRRWGQSAASPRTPGVEAHAGFAGASTAFQCHVVSGISCYSFRTPFSRSSMDVARGSTCGPTPAPSWPCSTSPAPWHAVVILDPCFACLVWLWLVPSQQIRLSTSGNTVPQQTACLTEAMPGSLLKYPPPSVSFLQCHYSLFSRLSTTSEHRSRHDPIAAQPDFLRGHYRLVFGFSPWAYTCR